MWEETASEGGFDGGGLVVNGSGGVGVAVLMRFPLLNCCGGGRGGGGAKVGSSRPCALCAHETACGRRRRLKAASMAEGW